MEKVRVIIADDHPLVREGFCHVLEDQPDLECVGIAKDGKEAIKLVKEILPDDCELVFLFSNPSAPMPNAKRRRDGTKRSHAEWASKNGFRWFSTDSLPKNWREE